MIAIVLSLCGTLAAYYLFKALYLRTGSLWFMPLVLCPIAIVALLLFAGVPYEEYRGGGSILQWLLGPATVAFAVPLYRQQNLIRKYLAELSIVGIVAAITAITTTMGIVHLFGVDESYVLSLAPRSITTPLAMNVSVMLGGNETITAVFVILTGVIGMLMTVAIIRFLNIHNPLLKGLLFGFTAHGTGTARAYEENEKAGVMASVAMIFMGVITALIAPFLVPLLLHVF